MGKKAMLGKEKLFISEFSDDYFKRRLQPEEDLEKFIRGCSDEVKERQKGGDIWHCILDVAVEKVCKEGLGNCFGSNSFFDGNRDCQELVADFYREPFFLKLDVAQAITYNLCRLGEKDTYDMEESGDVESWEEYFRDFLDIGRKMPEKDLAIDLIPGLDRLEGKYKDVADRSRVYFPKMVTGSRITLERNFAGLNVLYIGNEKFQAYLSRSGNKKAYFKDMEGYIAALDKENEPQQYAWEKMTGFNAINIIAKFLTEMAKAGGGRRNKGIPDFIKDVVSEYYYLFQQVMEMPNILTRLLLLKQIFNYGSGMEEKMSWGYLHNINSLLLGKNDRYKEIQECVLEVAVYIRWVIGEGNGMEAETWLKELEKEYPIELFEELMLYLNVRDGWYCKKKISINIGKNIDELKKSGDMKYVAQALRENVKEINTKWIEYEGYDILKDIRDLRYFKYRKELSRRLQRQGCFHISSPNFLEYLRREGEEGSELMPLGRICTKTHSELKGGVGEFVETEQELEKALRRCLLSDCKNVIFENTFMEEEQAYEKIMNFLFYHI